MRRSNVAINRSGVRPDFGSAVPTQGSCLPRVITATPAVNGALALLITAGVVAGSAANGLLDDRIQRDRALVIDEFAQRVSIEAAGRTEVVEVIDVTFTTQRRGIFPDLDIRTPFTSTDTFRDFRVDRGDASEPWNHPIEAGPTGPRIRVGEADVWPDPSSYRYRLAYVAPSWYDELADQPGIVEVRIDAPGIDWPTDIRTASLQIEVPGPVLDTACVEGSHRTTTSCANPPDIGGNRARFPFAPLGDREGATVLVRLRREDFAPGATIPVFAPAAPFGWRPAEVAGLRLRRDVGAVFLATLLWLLIAAELVTLDSITTPLHPVAGSIVAVLVMVRWGLIKALLRYELLPLTSAGRDATTRARAFARYLLTVEGEQLQWAAGQPRINCHHPALALLPYAVALGYADSWCKRFGPLLRQLAAAGAVRGRASTSAWWLHETRIRDLIRIQARSSQAPSSSGGGGGGGGGSGGGRGGGGSW